MAFDGLHIDQAQGGVRIITLADPDRRNALSDEMRHGLRDALRAAQDTPDVKAIVLTGAGGCFCAGGDIKAMGLPVPQALQRFDILHEIVRLIALGTKPVVAAVNGAAYGGGMSLALCCDLVVATETARFCASFARVGLVPDMGLMWSLPRRVGAAKAQQMMLSGREYRGAAAVDLGLADMLATGDPVATAIDEARALMPAAPLPAAHLRPINARHHGDLDAVLRDERAAQAALFGTDDHQEARRAFLEKRPPVFGGT